ncbi:sulfite exporter TauE/SafE family protein [Hwanghaeella sp.]|uniref:sulfite exporter TauE/SafE family protein n=1 Tax=Hwanghaeella sp. TaxID=2605943 RepID=UPI003CCBC90A
MEITASSGEIVTLVAALLAGGVATGFLAGLFGIGGGGIAVIVLFELFSALHVPDSVRMHVSVGTALVVMLLTAIRSFSAHKKRGAVDMDVIKSMGVYVVLGVLAGSTLAKHAGGDVMKGVWVCIAPIMAFQMFFGHKGWKLGEDIPRGLFRPIYGAVVGFASTLMSIGGGVFVSSMMKLYNRPIHQAIGTASGFGPLIGIPAVAGFIWAGWGAADTPPFSIGYINLPGAAIVSVASILAAPFGVKVAHALSRRALEIAFGCLLLFMSIRFLISILTT